MAVKKAKKAIARKPAKRKALAAKGPRYVCIPCGSEIVMTECGPEFKELVCCGVAMQKKS